MRVIMVMFDSLNRHMLPPYGCDWVHAPNFERLASRAVTFDTSYVCSMPCMPARRDLHTGRPNFLHRSWGPLEPWDDSVPEMLKQAGVHTHLCTDHYHYFEEGGSNYHTRYNTWEFFRGQEGDPWDGTIAEPPRPSPITGQGAKTDPWHTQDWKNRAAQPREEDQPQSQTFRAGVDFIEKNAGQDSWFLQLETFDPHEPYVTTESYKDLYREHFDAYDGPAFDWPFYGKSQETRDAVEHLLHENAALISMCDRKLGDVLDAMDRHTMWEDTMLIVWTDHGFLLGEHDYLGKCAMPFYEEVSHTPFFVWDPRSGKQGERRSALVQPSIDLGPTLLDVFGLEPTERMLGCSLTDTISNDEPVRAAALFGLYGHHANVTDGRYVYMRAPDSSTPCFEYTLRPGQGHQTRSVQTLTQNDLVEPFSFMQGCRPLRIPHEHPAPERLGAEPHERSHMLFDLHADPGQDTRLDDAAVEGRLAEQLRGLMQTCDAPKEQFQRLGL